MSEAFLTNKKPKSSEAGEDLFDETQATEALQENFNRYVMNTRFILSYVLEVLKENGFEDTEGRKKVEIMSIALEDDIGSAANKYFRQPGQKEPASQNNTQTRFLQSRGGQEPMSTEASETKMLQERIDLSLIFEYFSDDHWLLGTSIIELLRHKYLDMNDPVFAPTSFNEQISPEALLEKITVLVVTLYAMSTETRFIECNGNIPPPKQHANHKEAAEIVPRFQNFDLKNRKVDFTEAESRLLQRAKLLKKQEAMNQAVTKS